MVSKCFFEDRWNAERTDLPDPPEKNRYLLPKWGGNLLSCHSEQGSLQKNSRLCQLCQIGDWQPKATITHNRFQIHPLHPPNPCNYAINMYLCLSQITQKAQIC